MSQSVVVIGNFDGVHVGHQAVLRQAAHWAEQDAQALGCAAPLPVDVVTFWPHPLSVVAPQRAPELICGLAERIERLKAAGAHEVRVVPFTRAVAGWAPQAFVDTVVAPLEATTVVVGDNFRFGRSAAGSPQTLRDMGRFRVRTVDLRRLNGAPVSSTLIREALAEGRMGDANAMLGRAFRMRGIVELGDQRGRTLGFPTANVPVAPGLLAPRDGVYAGWLTRLDEPGQPMPAAISVGTNPTFDAVARHVEAYVLDRDDLRLYGAEVAVDFVASLRGMVRFAGVDELVAQMRRDVVDTRAALSLG